MPFGALFLVGAEVGDAGLRRLRRLLGLQNLLPLLFHLMQRRSSHATQLHREHTLLSHRTLEGHKRSIMPRELVNTTKTAYTYMQHNSSKRLREFLRTMKERTLA